MYVDQHTREGRILVTGEKRQASVYCGCKSAMMGKSRRLPALCPYYVPLTPAPGQITPLHAVFVVLRSGGGLKKSLRVDTSYFSPLPQTHISSHPAPFSFSPAPSPSSAIATPLPLDAQIAALLHIHLSHAKRVRQAAVMLNLVPRQPGCDAVFVPRHRRPSPVRTHARTHARNDQEIFGRPGLLCLVIEGRRGAGAIRGVSGVCAGPGSRKEAARSWILRLILDHLRHKRNNTTRSVIPAPLSS